LTLDLELWFQPEGSVENWHMVASREIHGPPGPVPTPNAITGPCLPGDYQIRYHVVGVSSQGEPFVDAGKGWTATLTHRDCGIR
jgi:hypothetical protein